MKAFSLKSDSYRRARGGTAQFLNLYCSNCHEHLLLYQKDGPGALLRLYADRIFAFSSVTLGVAVGSEPEPLVCRSCGALIATPMVYAREQRPAYHLRPGSFLKRRGNGSFPQSRLELDRLNRRNTT